MRTFEVLINAQYLSTITTSPMKTYIITTMFHYIVIEYLFKQQPPVISAYRS